MKFRPVLSALLLVLLGSRAGASADAPALPPATVPGPELASSQLYADLAAATRQNEQLKAALAEAQMRLSLREGDLADLSRQVAQLTAQAGSPMVVESASKAELTQLRKDLEQALAAATAAQQAQAALQSQHDATAKQLADTQGRLAALQAARPAQETAESPAGSTGELEKIRQDLNESRATADAAQLARADVEKQLVQTAAQLADTQAQLAAARANPPVVRPPTPALGSGSDQSAERAALQQEAEPVRAATTAAQAALAGLQSQLNQSGQQLSEARAAAPPDPGPSKEELAETTEKLNQALHAFTVQQGELDRAQAAQADADNARAAAVAQLAAATQAASDSTAALKAGQNELAAQRTTAAQIAAELAAVREQLRLVQAAAEATTAENQDLKTRLALAGGQPGSNPTGAPVVVFTPPPDSAPNPPTPAIATEAAPPRPDLSASPPLSPAAQAVAAEPRTHVVVTGDTLSGLAKKYYGNGARWSAILDANDALIKNPNVLPVGAKLQIP